MSPSARAARLALVREAFRSLSDRYLGADAGFDATYQVRLGELGRTWEIRCTSHAARVRQGVTSRRPDVTLSTDAETWLALREGELSGIDAFQQRRLTVRGNLDYAIAFEGLFRLPGGRPPLLQIHDVPARRQKISTLTMGHGPDVLLLHGLGGTRASLFETAAAHEPALPRARPGPAGLRILLKARPRRLQRPLVRRAHAGHDGQRRDRARPRRRQLDGRADRRSRWP